MTKYTLEIFPDEPRPKPGVKHKEVQLLFKDLDTKVAYVKAENRFTIDAFNEYLTVNANDKEGAQRALDLKRVTFAKQNNYYPKKGNKNIWEFTPNVGGDEPKRYA